MNRQCGGCTLCCKLLPVPTIDKPASTRCRYQSTKGYAVYHKTGFPRACEVWNCRWLADPDTARLRRPDRAHYVVDVMPDLVRIVDNETGEPIEIIVIQVWVDPAFPDAWRDPALLDYAEAAGEALLLRYNSGRAIFAAPPSMNSSGKWATHESNLLQHSRTGSMLLDKITEAQS